MVSDLPASSRSGNPAAELHELNTSFLFSRGNAAVVDPRWDRDDLCQVRRAPAKLQVVPLL